jgi:hypothetical protein
LTVRLLVADNGNLRRAGVTQLVECDLAKVDVAGSNPVSRSSLIALSQATTCHLHRAARACYNLIDAR